jgi:undecaprenyl-diphosphatase
VDALYHYLQIVLLGIVEGVTEFLPISSTGHLLIVEGLGLGHEPDVFNVVIQAGAILAVVFIYWHKIMDLLGSLDRPESRNYLMKVGLAFVVTSVVSLLLIKHFHIKLPETLTPVAWATLIGGFVIFAIEFVAKNLYGHDDVSWLEAALMGLAQVVAAVFPGASRSGSTIMTGLIMGMKRPAATQFSFLLGIPTMFAASALDMWRYKKDLTGADHQLLIDIAIGFLVSMVVAFFVVKWLLRFVQSHTFNGFAIYRVILGVALLTALATHAIPEGDDAKAKLEATKKGVIKEEPIPTLAPASVPTTNSDSSSQATRPVAPGTPVIQTLAPATDQTPVAPIPAATNAVPITNAESQPIPPGTVGQ